jgi:hypothetical protein
MTCKSSAFHSVFLAMCGGPHPAAVVSAARRHIELRNPQAFADKIVLTAQPVGGAGARGGVGDARHKKAGPSRRRPKRHRHTSFRELHDIL